MTKYSVAMVCDFFYPRLGGVENHIFSLAQCLMERGHKVVIITHSYDNRKGVRYMSGVKVYYCPFLPMTDQDILPTFGVTLPLFRWIMIREAINIVHSHQSTSTYGHEAITYASALGIPCVYTDHSLLGLDDLGGVILNQVVRGNLYNTDAAICVSHACRDNFLLRTHLEKERVSVIPNAVDPTNFTPDPSKRSTDRIKVVVVSRLAYRKGVDLLIEIIPVICRKVKHVDFIIGGDGPKMLPLQEMIEKERIEDRVELLGALAHTEVRDVLVRGHVFLNCSLIESFCIALLEAASTGLLVVSTNVGGIPEVLPDDMILLSNPDLPEMVDRLLEAIERQAGKDSLDPYECHARVDAMYSWRRVAFETEQVYGKISQRERKKFYERVCRYFLIGGITGMVICFMSMVMECWINILRIIQPAKDIDVVPDSISYSEASNNKRKVL